jgi:membrane protein YdbS with pleckstrin-like domain
MGQGKSPKRAAEPLVGTLAILIPLVLLCDIAAFALCFWWYDLSLRVSGAVAMVAPIALVLGIVTWMRFRASSETSGE